MKSIRVSLIKTIGSSLVLMSFGLLVAFVVLEISLRMTGTAFLTSNTHNDRPLFYYHPEDQHRAKNELYQVPKPPHVFRIAVVGDSFSYPTSMQFDDVFAKRLERMLRLHHPKNPAREHLADVINYGRPGFSTAQEVSSVDQALSEDANLLILQITLNDPERHSLAAEIRAHPGKYIFGEFQPKRDLPSALSWSKLAVLIGNRLHRKQTYNSYIAYHRDLFTEPGHWNDFNTAFQKIVRMCVKNQVPVVAVLFPLLSVSLGPDYPFLDIHEKVHSLAEKLHVPFIDLYKTYAGIPHEWLEVRPGQDGHPNEIAHRLAAERIYLALDRKHLVPHALLLHHNTREQARVLLR